MRKASARRWRWRAERPALIAMAGQLGADRNRLEEGKGGRARAGFRGGAVGRDRAASGEWWRPVHSALALLRASVTDKVHSHLLLSVPLAVPVVRVQGLTGFPMNNFEFRECVLCSLFFSFL